jgi:hypothetical protein
VCREALSDNQKKLWATSLRENHGCHLGSVFFLDFYLHRT